MNNEEKQTHLQELIRRKSRSRALADYKEFRDIICSNKFAQNLKIKDNGHILANALRHRWNNILEPHFAIDQTIDELTEDYIIEETEEIFKRIEFARSKNKEITNE